MHENASSFLAAWNTNLTAPSLSLLKSSHLFSIAHTQEFRQFGGDQHDPSGNCSTLEAAARKMISVRFWNSKMRELNWKYMKISNFFKVPGLLFVKQWPCFPYKNVNMPWGLHVEGLEVTLGQKFQRFRKKGILFTTYRLCRSRYHWSFSV